MSYPFAAVAFVNVNVNVNDPSSVLAFALPPFPSLHIKELSLFKHKPERLYRLRPQKTQKSRLENQAQKPKLISCLQVPGANSDKSRAGRRWCWRFRRRGLRHESAVVQLFALGHYDTRRKREIGHR
jgi:hypothetical protein